MEFIKYILIMSLLPLLSCTSGYYGPEDFSAVKKIDAHYHLNIFGDEVVKQAQADGFRLLTINVESESCDDVKSQYSLALAQKQKSPGAIDFAATFCIEGFGSEGWEAATESWLDKCIHHGAKAVKIWKNIGMSYRDQTGMLVMIDDPRFDPLIDWLAKKHIPVVGHLGEPKNCWLPLNEMTTLNDSSYFADNPQYYMYLLKDFPSYEEQMAARDRMLAKHPDLKFIGCHLASLEWNVDVIAAFLDRFPNAAVDMAARMGQLLYQTRADREKVRNFFIAYQDRILYGSDLDFEREADPAALRREMHRTWLNDWKYLTTDKTMTSKLIHGEFQGLKLPKDVIDKIYGKNAAKWYKLEN